tara:strand:- start:151 stop:342 length:192 start_codon:yes stop_codon:yes gene_type:complete
MNLERALEELFTGQKNVAKQAKELDMTTEKLKDIFREYAIKRPININDEDVWNAGTEPAWPYL